MVVTKTSNVLLFDSRQPLTSRLLSFPRKARQNCNYPDSPFDLRIRPLQQAPFADFAAEDLVQRSHGRAGGGGFEEAEET